MPLEGWLLVAALVICAVAAVGAALNSGPKHPRHAAPRHLEAVPDLPPGWGSMDLDAERTLAHPTVLLAAPVDPEPWRQRITAELSPEALADDSFPCGGACGDPYAHTFCAPPDARPEPADPGAGDADVVSSAPAPDPDWLEAQLAILFDWVRHVHAGALA